MKKNLSFYLVLCTFIMLPFASCDDDDPAKIALYLPKADFSHEITDLKVIFTDKSENVESYFWTFGDGTSSTDQNPTHEYATDADYTVELTVTGEKGKTNSMKEKITVGEGGTPGPNPGEKVEITVDGNFADWVAVPASRLAVATLDEAATALIALKEIKFCANESFIFMYVKLDTKNANAMDIYMNLDGDAENGYNSWMWDKLNAEYLIQGFLADGYDMRLAQYDESKGGGWGWLKPDLVPAGSGLLTISALKTVEGTIVEFEGQFVRDMIPNLKKQVHIGVGHSGKEGDAWSTSGALPTAPTVGDKNKALLVKLQ